jgi:hypothetical protein
MIQTLYMNERHAFGVAVRVIGVMVLLVAVLYVLSGIVILVDPHYVPNVSPAVEQGHLTQLEQLVNEHFT